MSPPLERQQIFPEPALPAAASLVACGRELARTVTVGPSPFLEHYGVPSELAYKEARVAAGDVMLHAQVGYRDAGKTERAFSEIYERLDAAGRKVDRYGICLDWSMGYPAGKRADMPRGTGLILESPSAWCALTRRAPVAPHFGDFVIGLPAALENTVAALGAGSTAIGNLGQYFTFRLPRWDDDVFTTAETVKAIALCAAQPVDVLIHSNLDDGFAALFCDVACALGAVLLEQYVVEDLLGARLGHCYGHTYSEPVTRLAFQRALARVANAPGTMVYGNTTSFRGESDENYAALGGYLLVDVVAQRALPTGHALNPVPITEAVRIPEIDEIVDAHLFAHRLFERVADLQSLIDMQQADAVADQIVEGGRRFKDRVLAGLAEAGVDTSDALELLLALRRVGAKRLEALFGPGEPDATSLRGRRPLIRASAVAEVLAAAEAQAAVLDAPARAAVSGLKGCVASTDVHEYGKILVEAVLRQVGVEVIDGGVSTDPDVLAAHAARGGAEFIAVSTYNGVALEYLRDLRAEMAGRGLDLPVFIGGKLNHVPDDSVTSLPVDATDALAGAGAVACQQVSDMLVHLASLASART